MAKVKGLNVPPELARAFGHSFSTGIRETYNLISRRRHSSGIVRGKRTNVHESFRQSVACWHFQSQSQKEAWYAEAQNEGMRYYNYFMQQTIPAYYSGNEPSYCVPITTGMYEVAGTNFSLNEFPWIGFVDTGDVMTFIVDFTCAGLSSSDSILFAFDAIGMFGDITRFDINITGGAGCSSWDKYSYFDNMTYTYFAGQSATLNNIVPTRAVVEVVFESPINAPDEIHGNFYFDCELSEPAALWISSYEVLLNGNFVAGNMYDDPPENDPPAQYGEQQLINFTNDPWGRYLLQVPSCDP